MKRKGPTLVTVPYVIVNMGFGVWSMGQKEGEILESHQRYLSFW